VLVNNAGLGYLGAIAETTTGRMRAAVDTNLLGVLYCTRRATAAMLKRGGDGDIVFISSDSSRSRTSHMLVYGATKAAVEYLRPASTSSWPAPASGSRR
jgi:glucose 1-dehydrogenase